MDMTFQQYVDEKYNIKTLGAYDYMTFCKKMKEKEFKKELFTKYKKENIKECK